MTFADSKQRFSNRVSDYVRYRPGYPPALIDLLRTECGLQSYHQVADIGSGTGLLSKLFLRNGNFVWGIEPNREMSDAAVEFLAAYPKFLGVSGSADKTTLVDGCVDFISVGQAFHWFEPAAARMEFRRILKPNSWVMIVWNDRLISETSFGRAYEDLLIRYGTDYTRVKEAYPETQDMEVFFQTKVSERLALQEPLSHLQRFELPNFQEFDFEGLAGRLRSSSYAPKESDANYAPMMAALRELFDATQESGCVRMDYTTQIYLGRFDAMRSSG